MLQATEGHIRSSGLNYFKRDLELTKGEALLVEVPNICFSCVYGAGSREAEALDANKAVQPALNSDDSIVSSFLLFCLTSAVLL